MRVSLLACSFLLASPLLGVESVKWSNNLPTDARWLAGEQARGIADNLLLYQYPSGGWPKNVDMAKPLTPAVRAELEERPHDDATIDNGATTTQIRFLAHSFAATQEPRYRAAVERGLDYLLKAQYPNGGWPQYFPLRKGYYTHITFNDGAMVNVLEVLRDVRDAAKPFAWIDEARRERARGAVERGIECILKCQIVQDGKATAWCAQHDEITFAPAWARKFEPPSVASMESAGVVRFLMSVKQPSPAVVAAIEAALVWFDQVKVSGLRCEIVTAPDQPGGRDRVAIPDPDASPIWARFYELGTHRPIFMGRDSVVRYRMDEIEHERRIGYAWYGNTPAKLFQSQQKWRSALVRSAP